MLLIYTPSETSRIAYVMDHVFNGQLGVEYKITTDRNAWLQTSTAKFSYTSEAVEGEVYFFANGLLNETGARKQELSTGIYNETPVLFQHSDDRSLLNFDVFAAVFYLLSRYEEYLDGERDQYGNYDYRNSILYKLNTLGTPLVERWIEILRRALTKVFPSMRFGQRAARYLLSFDIDVAYAYKNRSFARKTGGFLKKIFSLDFKALKDQVLTIFDRKPDMFDTYDYIFSRIKAVPAIFFFNMGDYGRFDKNPSYKNAGFRNLINSIAEKYKVGLHPSFASNKKQILFAEEKNKLERITGKKITASRQHYLRLDLPHTYRRLVENGIDKDFTMGYYHTYGFRAGTCNSFLFFDLMTNEPTNLRLYPFAFMEGTLNDVLKMNVDKAKQTVSGLIATIKDHGGIFIPLWHNSTLCDVQGWKGWREVFEHMIEELREKKIANITEL